MGSKLYDWQVICYIPALLCLFCLSVQIRATLPTCTAPDAVNPLTIGVMTRIAVSVAVASIIFVLQTIGNPAGGVVRLHPRQQALPCDVSSFVSALPPNATIEKVASVPELGSYGEGPPDEAYPWIPTGMPALCAVTVRVISSPSSSYRFGLFLPAPDKWQGRFLAVGNGGFSGGINWIDM